MLVEAELYSWYETILRFLDGYRDYHLTYSVGMAKMSEDRDVLEFDVDVHSDQGYGRDWTEYWAIYNNETIYASEKIFNGLSDFLANWC